MTRSLFVLLLATGLCAGNQGSIHVFVALCDNQSQGIVPVPEKLGNGNDLKNNLYWGAMYGVKSYLNKKYENIGCVKNIDSEIMERCIYKVDGSYVIADAYKGEAIRGSIERFINSISGATADSIVIEKKPVGINNNSDLIIFVGHNGLMDFDVTLPSKAGNGFGGKSAAALCCMSKQYFSQIFHHYNAKSYLVTTNLMAPEAYVLESVINSWILEKRGSSVIESAAIKYNAFQKCGIEPARRLFYSE